MRGEEKGMGAGVETPGAAPGFAVEDENVRHQASIQRHRLVLQLSILGGFGLDETGELIAFFFQGIYFNH